ncbi:MAG: DUF3445 domain-containing protein [Pseudomonadota bacterium]
MTEPAAENCRRILQGRLPEGQEGDPGLPGVKPCAADDWLRVDEAYATQMAYRAALLAERRDTVLYEPAATRAVACEVLEEALAVLPRLGFDVHHDTVTCPDGRVVPFDHDAPLFTLGHLVQEDICIHEKRGAEHVLTAAVLCFPANWRLSEKINQPLTQIHAPVPEYDATMAKRVQRMFDGVQVSRPLWRFNKLPYADPDLHQPYKREEAAQMPYTRSERQCILRMPVSRAVVFTIHTHVVHAAPNGLCADVTSG